jgi:hypothetical protein
VSFLLPATAFINSHSGTEYRSNLYLTPLLTVLKVVHTIDKVLSGNGEILISRKRRFNS